MYLLNGWLKGAASIPSGDVTTVSGGFKRINKKQDLEKTLVTSSPIYREKKKKKKKKRKKTLPKRTQLAMSQRKERFLCKSSRRFLFYFPEDPWMVYLPKFPLKANHSCTASTDLAKLSIIFHQPRFPWNKGISLTKPPFGENRPCEVAIICPDRCKNPIRWALIINGVKTPKNL